MALIEARGGFPKLKIITRYCMALPSLSGAPEGGWPVLWLLGDEGAMYNEWVRKTSVERFSEEYGIAVVMTEGLHSDYEDMKRGLDWYTFTFEELPEYLRETFPLSAEKQYLFGAGMGGRGALCRSLLCPGKYQAVGAVNVDVNAFSDDARHQTPEWNHRMETIYGDDFRSEEIREAHDLHELLKKATEKSAGNIMIAATKDDPENMKAFYEEMKTQGINNTSYLETEESGWSGKEAALRTFMNRVSCV